jgi:hypothetical protein
MPKGGQESGGGGVIPHSVNCLHSHWAYTPLSSASGEEWREHKEEEEKEEEEQAKGGRSQRSLAA